MNSKIITYFQLIMLYVLHKTKIIINNLYDKLSTKKNNYINYNYYDKMYKDHYIIDDYGYDADCEDNSD